MAVNGHHEPQGFIRKYVFSTDHKVIGLQYIFTAMLMGLVGTTLSLMIRYQLAGDPKTPLVAPETYLTW